MPFNGAGTFTRLYSWLTDKANGVKIQADRVDAEMDGIAAGLSNVITRDGQTTIIADIPFNGKRIKNLADPVDATDVVNKRTHDLAVLKAGDTMTGNLRVDSGGLLLGRVGTPNADLANIWKLNSWSDGRLYIQLADGSANPLRINRDGSLVTLQLGDLNTRIETRAAAFAEAARASAAADGVAAGTAANNNANGRVAKTGDTMTGDLTIQKSYPTLLMNYPGVRVVGWQVRDNGWSYLWDYSAGTWNLAVGMNGEVQTRQFGDLSARIEARAAAYAENARAAAESNANGRVAKTGDTMTGDLTISRASYPQYRLLWSGVINAGWMLDSDGSLMWRNADNGAVYFRIRPNGAIETSQIGDLHSRIEARADAYASLRAGYRVDKAGDTMTGPLAIGFDAPYFDLVYGNVMRSRQIIDGNGTWILRDGDNNDNKAYITTSGRLWLKEIGYVSDRIEARAQAYAEDRIASGYAGNLRDIGSSFGSNGYFRLSNGLILQWGHGGTGDTYVPFPVSFPNALLHVSGTCGYFEGLTNGVSLPFQVDNRTNAGFNARPRAALNGGAVGQVSGVDFQWFAIGY